MGTQTTFRARGTWLAISLHVLFVATMASACSAPQSAAPQAQPPAAVVASAPTAAPPAQPVYDMLGSTKTSTPNRPRYSTNIVVPVSNSREQRIAALADAARKTLAQHSDAKAVIVFAFSAANLVGKGFDVGRAVASSDRGGWTGDGSFDTFFRTGTRDQGRVYVTLGDAAVTPELLEVN